MRRVNSTYPAAAGGTSGIFRTGQKADIALSAIDFDNTGGPLLFNHQGGIATDGIHLLLADRNNNRVLVWNRLPEGNVPPDLVLGQPDFIANNPGAGLDQMSWPVAVSTDGQRVVVADTYNDRILIWNSFPAKSGAPADLAIQGARPGQPIGAPNSPGANLPKDRFAWPWGVWTDGQRLAVSNTAGESVLIWNRFPTQKDQPADIVLSGQGKMGTPRTITSDGKSLIVGDHNARVGERPGDAHGSFVWRSFPTADDQPFDFFMSDPEDSRGPWLTGAYTADGKLILLGAKVYIWNGFPQSAGERPALTLTGYRFLGGDGAAVASAGGRLFLSLSNANKVVVYNSLPTRVDQRPDFAVGSPDIETNTLDTAFIISNPTPASNGKSLFVASDFDRRLYVWRQLPDRSGSPPDLVYSLPLAPWAIALRGDTLALAGQRTVYVWKTLPLNGELPDLILDASIGGIPLQDLKGVALDEKYFYLVDAGSGKTHVWEGLPAKESAPKFTLDVGRGAQRISSDGTYVAVIAGEGGQGAKVFRVAELASGGAPGMVGGPGKFNLPMHALIVGGQLMVADTVFNRVPVWRKVEDALAGKEPDIVLGKASLDDTRPRIGRDQLFWPGALSFDGSYLWVGEFKFSERLLRFSPQ